MVKRGKNIFVALLIHLILGFVNIVFAQTNNPFFHHYAFMDKLPKDYSYYLNDYNETVNIINDDSILWCDKEFPYWRFLVANIGLLEPDSLIKQIWGAAYNNSPHSACGYYSFLFERSFEPGYLSRSPIVYYYLHHEKNYFDSICNNLFSKYDPSVIHDLRIIVTDDRGRGNREMNNDQMLRDSINQIKVAQIIQRLGKYPGRSVVGNSLEEVAWLVIQHAPLEYQEKYIPFIKAAVNNKDLKPKYLAYSVDRVSMLKGLPQIYGTQYIIENEIKRLYPVKDIQSIDAIRKLVGLGELKDYLVKNNILFPK